MKLSAWVADQGSGAISRLTRETGLSYSTVFAIVRGRSSPRYETAKLISDATGGAVSIADICERSS